MSETVEPRMFCGAEEIHEDLGDCDSQECTCGNATSRQGFGVLTRDFEPDKMGDGPYFYCPGDNEFCQRAFVRKTGVFVKKVSIDESKLW